MIRTSVIIRAHKDGSTLEVGPESGENGEFTLEQLKEVVGGWIETVPIRYRDPNGDDDLSVVSAENGTFRSNVLMVCDEEGKLKKDPEYNMLASIMTGTIIVGDVLLAEMEGL